MTLGWGPHSKLKILCVGCILPLQTSERPWHIGIEFHGRRFPCCLANATELEILREVFLDGHYEVPTDMPPPQTIVDLGSNIGVSILFFHALFPEARILGVEPDSATYLRLRTNVSRLHNVDTVNVAVAGAAGRREFHRAEQSPLSRFGTGSGGTTVAVVSLDGLLRDQSMESVDLLKIDIEGAETEALQAFEGLTSVKGILGEFHGRQSGVRPSDFFGLLTDFDIETYGNCAESCVVRGFRWESQPAKPPSAA